MTVIILAGGFGTRLQSVVKNFPKPMAYIGKKPFLEYLLEYLIKFNISKIIFCVGYKKEIIIEYFKDVYKGVEIEYSCEDKPLGTGGAIKKALEYTQDEKVLVLNGDTFFKIDLAEFEKNSNDFNYDIVIASKYMNNIDRYGAINIKENRVISFEEKKFYDYAYVNCGFYIIKKNIFDSIKLDKKFSFEKFLEENLNNLKIYTLHFNKSYFIDIGIPTDYEKAKEDFKELF